MRVIDQTETGGLTVTFAGEGNLVIQGFADGSEIRINHGRH
jgi:hypothetical protein